MLRHPFPVVLHRQRLFFRDQQAQPAVVHLGDKTCQRSGVIGIVSDQDLEVVPLRGQHVTRGIHGVALAVAGRDADGQAGHRANTRAPEVTFSTGMIIASPN